MLETLSVTKVDEVYMSIACDGGSCWELQDYFTFSVPGMQFMPQVRNKMWDGKIRLFNPVTKRLYSGLLPHVEKFCKDRGYNLVTSSEFDQDEFSIAEATKFSESINLPFQARDYQIQAFTHAIRHRRSLLLSPTASGKSLIIYLLSRYINKRTLIIVPTVSLVNQMAGDFRSYGYQDEMHGITAGVDKETQCLFTVSTWQSIYKMPKKWFDQFGCVIGDEAHNFKAKSLTSILTKMDQCKYRYGFTGTLDGTQTHKLVLEGLFGQVEQVTTTSELIDSGMLANFKIKCIVLQYSPETKKQHSKDKYQDEVDYIVRNEARNRFLRNLVLSLEGNTLLLYQFVDKHGKVLFAEIDNHCKKADIERPVHFVSGSVGGNERESIRHIVEEQNNAIIVASFGTFSTGVNIKRLHNIVFASPSKSRVRVLQSIGRGLRKGNEKTNATLFDIADNLAHNDKPNFTLDHFAERLKMYNDEKFDYKMYKVTLKEF